MSDKKISSRGVYYDLTISPYEYKSPYGDIFKFSSAKKLEIYTRDVPKEIERFEKLFSRHRVDDLIPEEILEMIYRKVYRAFYRKIEG